MRFDISDFVDVLTEQQAITNLVERFKLRRREAGFTQRELSRRSGVSYGSLRRFESTGEISLNSLMKLSNALGCLKDFNELFKYEIIKSLR